ncbi:MAG: PAS domain-containing sensor histidine kinase [Prevotella sp.]|nr:PAS domain-containing sensor histidine kinase [Prevotella sp.]
MNDINNIGFANIFVMVVILITILILTASVIHQLVKRNVKRATRKAMESNMIMQQAIARSDRTVIGYDPDDEHFYNIYGELLPKEGLSRKDILRSVHPDDKEKMHVFFEALLSGSAETDNAYYQLNVNPGGEPVWHHVHTHAITEYEHGRRSGIILNITDETNEQRARKMDNETDEKYTLIFENSIIGISFYDPDGYLIDANRQMREICNFESRYDSLYYETPIYDILSSPTNRGEMQDYWGCQKIENPKRNVSKYVESRIRPIYDENGHLKYTVVSARDITQERELYMQSKLNNEQISYASREVTRYEEQLRYLLEHSKMHVWRSSFEQQEITFFTDLHQIVRTASFDEFGKMLQSDDEQVRKMIMGYTEAERDVHDIVTQPFIGLFEQDGKTHWYNINSLPIYDKQGRQTGNFGLIRDTTMLIEEQEMLKRETERANDSGRLKSVFLANMTHEIRTPLNAIVGFSDLLHDIESPDDKREMMRIIRNNCDMLLRLVNDVLIVSNMESNGITMNKTEFDFASEFDALCHSLAGRVTEPGVEFIIDNPCETLPVCLDKERIAQVATNFVTNAVKYTQQGHIKLGYRPNADAPNGKGQDGLLIYCEDTGSGIPKEDCERIFERFVKLNDYIQGTGLGLSICKAIAKNCNGQIGVDSEVGKGSTFWFWLPLDSQATKDN